MVTADVCYVGVLLSLYFMLKVFTRKFYVQSGKKTGCLVTTFEPFLLLFASYGCVKHECFSPKLFNSPFTVQ